MGKQEFILHRFKWKFWELGGKQRKDFWVTSRYVPGNRDKEGDFYEVLGKYSPWGFSSECKIEIWISILITSDCWIYDVFLMPG